MNKAISEQPFKIGREKALSMFWKVDETNPIDMFTDTSREVKNAVDNPKDCSMKFR